MSEVKRYDSYVQDGVVHFEAGPEGAWMSSDDVQSELAALLGELAQWKHMVGATIPLSETLASMTTKQTMVDYFKGLHSERDTLRKSLTAAEQRNAELVELLKGYPRGVPGFAAWSDKVTATLKPTESGASE